MNRRKSKGLKGGFPWPLVLILAALAAIVAISQLLPSQPKQNQGFDYKGATVLAFDSTKSIVLEEGTSYLIPLPTNNNITFGIFPTKDGAELYKWEDDKPGWIRLPPFDIRGGMDLIIYSGPAGVAIGAGSLDVVGGRVIYYPVNYLPVNNTPQPQG